MDDTEAALVTIRVSLAESIRVRRQAAGLTQAEVAKLAATTQARVAKAENANPEVSLDLCMRILLTLGGNPKTIARAIAARFKGMHAPDLKSTVVSVDPAPQGHDPDRLDDAVEERGQLASHREPNLVRV